MWGPVISLSLSPKMKSYTFYWKPPPCSPASHSTSIMVLGERPRDKTLAALPCAAGQEYIVEVNRTDVIVSIFFLLLQPDPCLPVTLQVKPFHLLESFPVKHLPPNPTAPYVVHLFCLCLQQLLSSFDFPLGHQTCNLTIHPLLISLFS